MKTLLSLIFLNFLMVASCIASPTAIQASDYACGDKLLKVLLDGSITIEDDSSFGQFYLLLNANLEGSNFFEGRFDFKGGPFFVTTSYLKLNKNTDARSEILSVYLDDELIKCRLLKPAVSGGN